MKRIVILLLSLSAISLQALAQVENPEVRRGNREYKAENFRDAEMRYREALESNPQSRKALYNLANTLYRQGRYDEAVNILDGLSQLDIPDNQRADIYHNLGNARIGNQEIAEGIESYKNALRIRPQDMDTRHNLAYAKRLLQEQEQEQDQDQEDQENDEEQQQDQQPQDGDDEQDQDQQQQPRPDQISPEDAQRILDALNQQEQDIQEKIDREEKQRAPRRPQREW